MPLILSGNVASATAAAYDVANSCRFNDGDSPKLNINFGSDGTLNKWTFSMWFKRSTLGTAQRLFCVLDTGMDDYIKFGTDDQLEWTFDNEDGTNKGVLKTNRKFRDVGAFYHLVCRLDTTDSTAGDRMRMYINGTEETSFATDTNPTVNETGDIGRDNNHYIGTSGSSQYFDGYIAEVCMINNQSLAPTSFGEFDSDSPTIWKPIDVSGLTAGTNGFYLDFEDSANLGNDAFGGTDWTETNLDATDQATDTPTNNFAVCNSLDNFSTGGTFSEANLQTQSTTSNRGIFTATHGVSSGVWYWEIKTSATGGTNSGDQWNYIGIAGQVGASNTDNILGSSGTNSKKSHEYALQAVNGSLYNNGDAAVAYGASFTEGDIVGIKLDLDNNRIYFSKNGQWADGSGNFDESDPSGYISIAAASTTESGFYFPAWGDGGVNVNKTWQLNFGGSSGFSISSANQDPNGYGNFEYDTKSGYAICTKNIGEFGG
jgi:hypothetical protein